MAVTTMDEFCPVPFPEGLPTIELERISLAKLLDNDDLEASRLFDVCTKEGFFYLNLMDHPKGLRMLEAANVACRTGKESLGTISMAEKQKFKGREKIGIFDTGYRCTLVDDDGEPETVEAFNLPQYELLNKETEGFTLPTWLSKNEDTWRSAMRDGNTVANIILGVLERELQVPTGSLTSLHRMTDRSSDFLRVLRYPKLVPGKSLNRPGFPPHRDAVSVAILFTWLGGLQIPMRNAKILDDGTETEDSWRWVEPLPGHAIVNLGDAMQILTNNVLKSGKHRVVKAPGPQAGFDRYSVLLGTRPANATPMSALKSPMIPEYSADEAKVEVINAQQWGAKSVGKVLSVMEKK